VHKAEVELRLGMSLGGGGEAFLALLLLLVACLTRAALKCLLMPANNVREAGVGCGGHGLLPCVGVAARIVFDARGAEMLVDTGE